MLPGGLVVDDGPFRGWFNADFQGFAGTYHEGREVGQWKECDRFSRCEQKVYPAVDPDEKKRQGFKPEIPVTYIDGKYVFDFASCRFTPFKHRDGEKTDLRFSLGPQPQGCAFYYTPVEDEVREGPMKYSCTIPFQTGTRAFGSLDLMNELPKAGLPQYCVTYEIKTFPYMSSVDPGNGEGVEQVFTAEFSLGNTGVGIAQARLHFQERAESRSDRCVVRYEIGKAHV